MTPSKEWMELVDNHLNEIYLDGVQEFLDYAFIKQEKNMKYDVHLSNVTILL